MSLRIGYISTENSRSWVTLRYSCTATKYQRLASTVLYSGTSPASGNRFGSMPWLTNLPKVRSTLAAIALRPVASVRPGSAIIVSRPQSLNQG